MWRVRVYLQPMNPAIVAVMATVIGAGSSPTYSIANPLRNMARRKRRERGYSVPEIIPSKYDREAIAKADAKRNRKAKSLWRTQRKGRGLGTSAERPKPSAS